MLNRLKQSAFQVLNLVYFHLPYLLLAISSRRGAADWGKWRRLQVPGDSDVVLERILPPEVATEPVCIAGERRCPPGDVGGPYGYKEFPGVIFFWNADSHGAESTIRRDFTSRAALDGLQFPQSFTRFKGAGFAGSCPKEKTS
jgi:hypothetical protein